MALAKPALEDVLKAGFVIGEALEEVADRKGGAG